MSAPSKAIDPARVGLSKSLMATPCERKGYFQGLDYLRPYLDGIRIQGNDGESLRAGDIIGTPDYLLPDGSVVDVKTSGRRYSEAKFWQSPEMGIYALLATAEAGGELPPKLILSWSIGTEPGRRALSPAVRCAAR